MTKNAKFIFFLLQVFFIYIILDCFDILMLKINFNKIKNYFNIFLNKKTLKKNNYYNLKHYISVFQNYYVFQSNMKFKNKNIS